MINILLDTSLINLVTGPKGDSLNYRSEPTTSAKILVTKQKGTSAGRTTGNYTNMPDGKWYQVVLNPPSNAIAWVRSDVTGLWTPTSNSLVSDADATSLVDKLVKADDEIFHSLIRSGVIVATNKQKGKNVSSVEKQIADLTARLNRRQDKIKTSKILKWKTGIKAGYDKAWAWTKKILGISGIGAVPVVVVVVAALAGAGLATAAYFAFKPDYDESTVDLKVSKDLEELLNKADPQTAQEIKANLEKQVDDAYNRGKTDGSFGGIFKTVKYLAFFFLGYIVIDKGMQLNDKRRGKK